MFVWCFFRVELHNFDDYDLLHKAMEKQGFCRDIQADDGQFRQLPTGLYRFNQPLDKRLALTPTLQQLGDRVRVAAGSVHPDFEYIGFESPTAVFYNLESVRAPTTQSDLANMLAKLYPQHQGALSLTKPVR